jgi:CRP-like cAMP-binding protein
MPLGFVLYEPDEAIDRMYFPQTAVVSVSQMRDGAVAEISMIGPEGLTGWEILLEKTSASARMVCSMPGTALAVRADALLRHVESCSDLRSALFAYLNGYLAMLAQLIACNRLHRVEQRCARWLLMTADRVNDVAFPLTQERLSAMLGSQRSTLTTVMASLREAGCVGGRRGVVEILDRPKLESFACECYDICASIFRPDTSIVAPVDVLSRVSVA